jgi:uncharacterized protein (TIGR03437 family)
MWFKQALGVAMTLAGSALMSSCCCSSSNSTSTSKTENCTNLSQATLALAIGSFNPVDCGIDLKQAGLSSQSLECKAVGGSNVSALERQSDGSFTQWQYLASAPYSFVGSAPNYETNFSNASGAGARTFKNLPGWKFLADRLGVSTQSLVFANLLGNGTPVGLSLAPAGFNGGPNATSLMVQAFNPDGSAKSPNFYAVPASPVGILVADFNRDGKDDVVVVGENSNTPTGWTNNSIAVYLGNGDGTLKAPVFISGNQGTYSATAYDFNGDGNLDLAVVNLSSGDVSILLGKGDGTFAPAVNYTAVSHGFLIVAGDFNGDGKADLAVASATSVAVLLGKGDGSFNAAVTAQATFTSISALATGDFNNDHKLDLAVSDSTSGMLSILLGDGTGKFPTEHDYAIGYGVGNLFAMDLDGDGNLDLVIASGHPDVLTATPYLSDMVLAYFGRGDGTLIGPPEYRVGAGLDTVAVADFNGDGKPDIAAASGSLWILLASGGGAFKTPVSINLGSGVSANGLAAADLNGDGKQDLVVGDFNGSGIYVLLGNGDGTFQAPVQYSVGGRVTSIAIADFNGDGKPDIAVSGAYYNTGATIGILLGNGNGTFQTAANLSGATNPVSLTVGDFNNDGKLDLAIADQGTWPPSYYPLPTDGGVLVYLGKGNGGFQSPVRYAAGLDPAFVVAADVNADHNPDLLVGTFDPNWNTNGQSDVAVLLGNGNGTFKAASYMVTEEAPNSIAVADFNGDGNPDLAIAHCCSGTFATLMFGNGDGTFQAENLVPAASSPSTVAAADLNGDGKPDLIAGLAQYSNSAVGIFLNTSPSAPAITLAGIGSAANYVAGKASPGEIIVVYGQNFGPASLAQLQFTNGVADTSIGSTQIYFDNVAAPMIYAVGGSSSVLSCVVPYEVAGEASTQVQVEYNGVKGNTVTVPVVSSVPGIFSMNQSGAGPGAILNWPDYSVNSATNPVAAGGYIMAYGTGEGKTNVAIDGELVPAAGPYPLPLLTPWTATVGGEAAVVIWAGSAPDNIAGVFQVNVQIPPDLKTGAYDLVIKAGSFASTAGLTVAVK